ncbi:MAG TPA: HNH endonuclease signature motif containing protein [Thermoanaerobaculia bacterium]
MSTGHISAALRRLVAARAENLCEYCLIHEEDTFFGCEVDHIISLKHGGPTQEDNLAFACLVCNRNKGSDIASLIPGTEDLIRLFNPRADSWGEHFYLDSADMTIVPLTAIGEATVRILGLNESGHLLERHALQAVGRYPTAAAGRHMSRSL